MPFDTTHWSVVVAAQDSDFELANGALDRLCVAYWQPVYSYLRHKGYSVEDSQDLTQEFFLRFVDRTLVRRYERQRGRFRTFLLTALSSFVHDEWRQSQTLKRGGAQTFVPFDQAQAELDYEAVSEAHSSPETLFERRWALNILEHALKALREEFEGDTDRAHFDMLKPFLTVDEARPRYKDLAQKSGMTESALKVAVHRMRNRYREHIRQAVAHTLADPAELDDELQYLIQVLSD